jgi:hypothetical protein
MVSKERREEDTNSLVHLKALKSRKSTLSMPKISKITTIILNFS